MSDDATPILHMLSPQKHISPFDVNMGVDAGYKAVIPYINTTDAHDLPHHDPLY